AHADRGPRGRDAHAAAADGPSGPGGVRRGDVARRDRAGDEAPDGTGRACVLGARAAGHGDAGGGVLAHRLGRQRVRADDALGDAGDAAGLVALARQAELATVPELFGFKGVKVQPGRTGEERAAGLVQEYEVSWRVPD